MYDSYANRARDSKAIGDIGSIAISIETFRLNNRDRVPSNLNELPISVPTDPWGNDYAFLNIIDDQPNDALHIVRFVRFTRNNAVEGYLFAEGVVRGRLARRVV